VDSLRKLFDEFPTRYATRKEVSDIKVKVLS